MKKILLLTFIFHIGVLPALNAQHTNKNIEIKGVVFSGDSLNPKAGVEIFQDNNTPIQTTANGFFTIQAAKGDSLLFKTGDAQDFHLSVPDSLKFNQYLIGIFFDQKTSPLPEVILLPYYTKESFEKEFLNLNKSRDEQNAAANLDLLKLQAETGNIGFELYNGPDIAMWQFQNKIVFKGLYGPENSVQVPVLGVLGLFYSVAHNAIEKEKVEKQIYDELKRIKIERETSNIQNKN